MKTISPVLLAAISLLPVLATAQVRETPATLALIEGGNPQGYIQGSNDQGILFASSSGGQARLVPYAKIRGEGLDKLIRFEERVELLGTPRSLYAEGQFHEAAEAYGKVARDYAIVLAAPQNFASEALFYQIESLKRAGQYAAMAPLVESPAAATIGTKLPAAYQRPFEFQKLWAIYGKNDMPGLKSALAAYQEPVTGAEKLLEAPNFKSVAPAELAQLAFLRGKVYESEGAKEIALTDYYRTFTVAYGNDVLLAKLAMGAAMLIQKGNPRIAAGNKEAVNQMRSIAYFYALRFGKESMPAEFQAFAVKPELPPVLPPSAAPKEEAPKEEAPAPAAKEKAEEKKKAE